MMLMLMLCARSHSYVPTLSSGSFSMAVQAHSSNVGAWFSDRLRTLTGYAEATVSFPRCRHRCGKNARYWGYITHAPNPCPCQFPLRFFVESLPSGLFLASPFHRSPWSPVGVLQKQLQASYSISRVVSQYLPTVFSVSGRVAHRDSGSFPKVLLHVSGSPLIPSAKFSSLPCAPTIAIPVVDM